MTGICISEHFDTTPFNNKSKQNQPLNYPKINMTPTKYKQQDCDHINDEIGSPVLGSTALSNLQSKSFISSTPACNRAEPATPESKKSVRNILDQLCSPISGAESEEWQFKSSIHESKQKLTPACSNNEKVITKIPKPFSTDPKSNNCFNKSSQKIVKDNQNVTQNDLFDDISDISLQFLCEATNHIVDNQKSNENININIRSNSDHEILNEENINLCANKEKVEPPANLPLEISFNCNNERTELIDTVIFENRKLIYSNKNFRLNAPSSIHLIDLFSEVKFLEEANRTFKKELKPRDSQVTYKANQNKSTTCLNLSNIKENDFQSSKNLDPVQSELETENKILNDSIGISDTQFCEAVEAAELMSNLDATFNTNINATGNTAHRINLYNVEKGHQESRGKIESCISNTKSEIPTSSLYTDVELLTFDRFAPEKNNYEGLLLSKVRSTTIQTFENSKNSKQSNVLNQSVFEPFTEPISFADINSETNKLEENTIHEKNREIVETPGNPMMKGTYFNDTSNIKSVSKMTICQTQAIQYFKTSETYLKKAKDLSSDATHGTVSVLKDIPTSESKCFEMSDDLIVKALPDCKQSHSDQTKIYNPRSREKAAETSQEILTKGITLLNNDGSESEPVLNDFQMGSGKVVKVSKNLSDKPKQLHLDSSYEQKLIPKSFQTASLNSVELSEELMKDSHKLTDKSLIKTKSLLKDLSYESDQILEGFKIPSSKSVKKPEKTLRKATSTLYDLSNESELFLRGFQTASGKIMKVSEKSLEKAKHLLDCEQNVSQTCFQTESEKFVDMSKESLKKARIIFDYTSFEDPVPRGYQMSSCTYVESSGEEYTKMKRSLSHGLEPTFKGFQTASGKSVKISQKSLEKAKQLFDDDTDSVQQGFQTENGNSIKKTNDLFDDGPNVIQKYFQTASGKSVKVSKASLEKAKQLFDDGTHLIQTGFQSSSGELLKISEESLEQAKQLFYDEPNLIQEDFQTAFGKSSEESSGKAKQFFVDVPNLTQKGNQAVSGRSVKVSEESLQQLNKFVDVRLNIIQKGFQTASGKSVQISEESLKIAKQLFDDGPSLIQKGFQTASGKSVKVSEESLEQAKQLFDDRLNIIQKGFQTASGKSVQISEESLKIAKQLFDDGPNLIQKGFQTASGKSVQILEESLKIAKQLFDDGPSLIQKGFQTAIGKSVKVSEESLEQAKQLFDDRLNIIQKGFQTASGKSVQISEESLKIAKQLFDDGPNLKQKGFQTASGKSVKVSEESLEQAKQLFDDQLDIKHGSFQTASGKSVEISEESLKIAKQLFDDGPNLIQKGNQPVSKKSVNELLEQAKQFFYDEPNLKQKGFQTASGKSVKVSEESLEQAKQLFDDQLNLIQKDFQTASEKFVKASEESLEQAKPLFYGDLNLIRNGFQTASGKSVKVSKEALEKAKHLFDDGSNLIHKDIQPENGNSIEISKGSLRKLKNSVDNISPKSELTLKRFQIFSRNPYKLSEESLKTSLKLLDEVNCKPCLITKGFQTEDGKSVKISEESLTKAQNLMNNISHESDHLLKGYQPACGKSVGVVVEGCPKTLKNIFDDASLKSHSIVKGFQTAGGKSVKISEESLKKAKNLLDNTTLEARLGLVPKICKSPCKNSNQNSEKILSKEEHSHSVLKNVQTSGGKCVDIFENSLKKVLDTLDDASPKPQSEPAFKAFQTASGKGVHISEESLKKAKNLLGVEYNETGDNLIGLKKTSRKSVKCNDSQKETVFTLDKSYPKIDKPGATLSSRASIDNSKSSLSLQVMQEENCSVCNDMSGVENVPQAETNHRVIHLEEEKRKRKYPIQSDCSFQMDKTSNSLSLNAPLLDKVKKSHYNCLRKRRKLFIETDQSNEDKFFYDDENSNSIIGASVISEADLSLLNQSRTSLSGNESQIYEHCSPDTMSPSVAREVSESMAALLADEASNSPFSLKPCVSSPGMLYDRQVRLPSLDCYENEVCINKTQLSPILGSRCSLKQRKLDKHQTGGFSTPITFLNKTANSDIKSSSFKPPYATSTPLDSQLQSKRKSIYSNFHTQTEKRQKIVHSSENETVYDLSKARLEVALKQEQYVKEKMKKHEEIKPCKGLYLLRKQTEKNRSLRDLTANGSLRSFTTQQLNQYGVKKSIQEISIQNVTEFKFVAVDYFSKETASSNVNGIPIGDGAVLILDGEGKAGVKEITRAFLASPSIDPSLISNEWVENHFKWIVLKMAAMERMFPREFGNRYLTPNNLMLQLKYRYDREIDRSQRSALRKILEKDESPAKTMVLFVANILDAEVQPDKEKHVGRKELELSDGWYSVKATVDHEMEMLVRSKKVAVGTKLMVTGAELSNNEAGCHPLEMPANVRLRVSTNSTRRARWFARLGFHARSPHPAKLREVLGRGGALPALTAVVARTYPTLFLEKVNGRTVIRNERAEQTAADEYQTKRQQCAEAILSQLQQDLESSRPSKKHPVTRTLIKHATNTKRLYSLLDGVDDISFLQDILSKEQMNEIQQLKEEEMRKAQQQLQDRLVDQLDKKIAPRNVSRMLKVRLVDEEQTDRSALLTVWNPSDDVMSYLTEGNLLTFYNISASGFSRFGDLQLTAGKQTKYSLQKHCSCLRRITSLSELQDSELKPRFSEVDVVGLVVESTDTTPDKTSNLIYLADSNHNFISVSFWTDLKATGYASTLTPGSLVAASNLHWRSHLVSWKLPSAYATEMSMFSQHPRQPHLQEALAQLRNRVQSMNLAKYVGSCQDRIKSLVAQRNCGGVQQKSTSTGGPNEAVSVISNGPVCGNSNHKLVRDKVDSSVTENVDTPTNRRLEMLERYGEPPSISPLSTSTPTSVKRSFRPPMRKFSGKS